MRICPFTARKHAGSFDFILDTVSADHDINAYLNLLGRDGNITPVGRSTVIGPTCRQETEKLEGSSFRPKGWPQPPFLACEM